VPEHDLGAGETDDLSASLFSAADSDSEHEDENLVIDRANKRRRLSAITDVSQDNGLLVPKTRAASSESTLIILDWDDTLLPSSWLLQEGLSIAPDSAQPNEEQRAELGRVASSVIETLQRAKRLGRVEIVTAAEKGWVELTCFKFLPQVFPSLEGVKIVSARSTFEHLASQSANLWKCPAFKREVDEFFGAASTCQPHECLKENIISVGDSMHERTALFEVAQGRDCWAKSVKLMVRPSLEHIVQQHALLHASLKSLTNFVGSLDLRLKVPV